MQSRSSRRRSRPRLRWQLITLLLMAFACAARGQIVEPDPVRSGDLVPDLRGAELPASVDKGNWVAVPIPISSPTLGTGLIAAAAYFYPQTEAQQQTQPASATGVGAMYTDNGSYGVALGHVGYWREDRWRFTGAVAYADVEMPLLALDEDSNLLNVDWLIKGSISFAEVARRIGDRWYFGGSVRYVDVDQDIRIDLLSLRFDILDSFAAAGIGTSLTFDTRDVPTNPYSGRYFKVGAFFNRPSIGGELSYDAYSLSFRSYHELTPNLVLAWELAACARSDGVPLWDACRIGLRGFPSTDHLGKSSERAQAEARWRLNQRWGLAAFAGGGQISETLTGLREDELIPSYGAGLRFTVNTKNRINMRLDYARSNDTDAVYLFVGEAF